MIIRVRSVASIAIVAGLTFGLAHCGGEKDKKEKKDDEGQEDTVDGAGTIVGLSENGLSGSYPEGLTVSAFPQEVDPSPGAAAAGTVQVSLALQNDPPQDPPTNDPNNAPDPNGGGSFKQEHAKNALKDHANVLNGKSSECFNEDELRYLTFNNMMGEMCYGFDYGMVAGKAIGMGDLGRVNNVFNDEANKDLDTDAIVGKLKEIEGFQADSSGEVCMVARGRTLIEATSAKLSGALALFRGFLCEAKKAGKDKMTDSELDLTTIASDKVPNVITVTSAKITSLAKQDGRAVFKTEVEFETNMIKDNKLVLFHSPGKDGNETYNGVLNLSEGKDNNGLRSFKSMAYQKSGSTHEDSRLQIEVRDVRYEEAAGDVDPYDSNGVLDPNSGVDENSGNEKLSGIKYFAFDVNPSSYAGEISFWNNPGGNYGEAARGFVYKTTQNDDGGLSGCAWSGSIREVSIRKALKEGTSMKPDGCYVPQYRGSDCGQGGDNIGSQVWKQCFIQDKEGVYLLDSAKTTDTSKGFDMLSTAPSDIPDLDLSGIATLSGLK